MRGPTRIMTTLVAALLLVLGVIPARADGVGPCDLSRGEGETVQQLSRRMIRCATDRWPVDGGAARAICIADHESGLDPRVASPGGTYLGLFQHSAAAWPDRYREWTRPTWALDESALSARTNVIVTIRMVNAGGWGPWAGVDGC